MLIGRPAPFIRHRKSACRLNTYRLIFVDFLAYAVQKFDE